MCVRVRERQPIPITLRRNLGFQYPHVSPVSPRPVMEGKSSRRIKNYSTIICSNHMVNHAYEIPEGSWVPNFPFEIGLSWQNIFQNHENQMGNSWNSRNSHSIYGGQSLTPFTNHSPSFYPAILGKSPGWSMDIHGWSPKLGASQWDSGALPPSSKITMLSAAPNKQLAAWIIRIIWIMDVPFSSEQSPDTLW